MPANLVQSKAAAVNTGAATTAATWDTAATAGNLLLLTVGSDDYRLTSGANRPESSGFTLSTGCAQETFLGHYVWWKVAAGGETSVSYTIGSASTSAWITAEWSGLTGTPYDISAGQLTGSPASSYTTPAITPTAGERLLVGCMGMSLSQSDTPGGMDTWLNSFTEVTDVFSAPTGVTRDLIGVATQTVTANGATAYSTGATVTGAVTPQTLTGIILAFAVASGGAAPVPRQPIVAPSGAVMHAATH